MVYDAELLVCAVCESSHRNLIQLMPREERIE